MFLFPTGNRDSASPAQINCLRCLCFCQNLHMGDHLGRGLTKKRTLLYVTSLKGGLLVHATPDLPSDEPWRDGHQSFSKSAFSLEVGQMPGPSTLAM